jgi:serine/threonine protein kinase
MDHKYKRTNCKYQKINISNKTLKQSQTGGKFIDKGGFGCVITPALKCSNKDKNMDKMVSKIIRNADSDITNELKISNILKKLDPTKKYYITFDKYCYINKIPEDRNDLISVHYTDSDMSNFEIEEGQSFKDKNACDIELSLKPLNLIMEYGGYNLSSIIKSNLKIPNTKSKMHALFIDNLPIYFKHLILGIVKMHFNRIVNRDIKPKNIMMNWNKETNQVLIRYIDFGLSDLLTNDFCNDINNIKNKGTPTYIAPELMITYILKKYYDRSENYILKKIHHEIEENVKYSITRINEKELLGNLNENINNLYLKIKSLYEDEKILPIYFGTNKNKFNGYTQKADIYALGLSIFLAIYTYSNIDVRKDNKLYDLLIHMIAFDPDKRYNAVQCLAHPYFHPEIKKIES